MKILALMAAGLIGAAALTPCRRPLPAVDRRWCMSGPRFATSAITATIAGVGRRCAAPSGATIIGRGSAERFALAGKHTFREIIQGKANA